jgi:hypothetical protein
VVAGLGHVRLEDPPGRGEKSPSWRCPAAAGRYAWSQMFFGVAVQITAEKHANLAAKQA